MTHTLEEAKDTAGLLSWVLQQIPGTFIWSEDLSCLHCAPEQVLDELSSSNSQRIQKVEEGVYFIPEADHVAELGFNHYLLPDAGVQRAGAGSGYANATAVHVMRWSWHPTPKTYISTLNDVSSASALITFERSSNHRRLLLNAAEVSVLEALLAVNAGYPHFDWQHRHRKFVTGHSVSCLSDNAVVSMSKLRWAAETEEPSQPDVFWSELNHLSRDCPDRLISLSHDQLVDALEITSSLTHHATNPEHTKQTRTTSSAKSPGFARSGGNDWG